MCCVIESGVHPTCAKLYWIIAARACLVAKRHAFEFIKQTTPVVSEHLRVLDSLLCPILIPTGDVVLGVLEICELITNALLDKYRTVVLVDDSFLVLR